MSLPRQSISLSSLLKAPKKIESFRQQVETDQQKAGAIHAFEYCFELAWKTMKRIIESNQTEKLWH